jgi:hypothetical protein
MYDMTYDVGTRFFSVEKHYSSRIMREYRVDENGERWYREKPQSYKIVISEQEILSKKTYTIEGDASLWYDNLGHIEYAIKDVNSTDPDNERVVFVGPGNFECDNVFFNRADAEKYAATLKPFKK